MSDIAAALGVPETPIFILDVEFYPNFAMVGFKNVATGLVHSSTSEPGIGQSLAELRNWWQQHRTDSVFVGFNTLGYDNRMLQAVICEGQDDPAVLFALSNELVRADFYRLHKIDGELTVDLQEVCGGREMVGSLKEIGITLDHPTLRELPYAPDMALTHEQMQQVAQYNSHDLAVTEAMLWDRKDAVAVRVSLMRERQVDLLSSRDSRLIERLLAPLLFDQPRYPHTKRWRLAVSSLTAPFDFVHPALGRQPPGVPQRSRCPQCAHPADAGTLAGPGS